MATIIRPGEMVDVETLRDLWESDLARAGWDGRDADEWDQVPIPIISSDPETTWIWSDLHLGDPSVISVFGRPFIEVGAMNAFLLGEWCDRVQAGHTIICLGDLLHEDVWRNESLMNEIRSCPGDRILVLGNHDGNGLRLLGFTVQHTLALCATDPPMALSHEPLRQIPPGAICVHGHLHEGTEPTVRAHQPDRRAKPCTGRYGSPGSSSRPESASGPSVTTDDEEEQGRSGRRRARGRDESRLEGDYRALARLRSESAALVSTGSGPGAGRATLSSLAGLTSLWRNASSSRLRLGVSSAECEYSFPVHLAYFFEVLGLQLSIRHWRSSTFSGPARGPAGPKEPGREGRGTARRGEGQDFDCGGRRHGMAISTMFRRVRVLGPGTVLPSIRRRASRLMSLSLTG